MIDLETALETIINSVTVLEPHDVPLDDLVGCVLARDIVAPIDVSSFRNSAMDGFAVSAKLLQDCSVDAPVTLSIAGVSYAGGDPPKELEGCASGALKIMTGAPVPESYDTVIKVEDTTFTESVVTFTVQPKLGANIRPCGEDMREGETIFRAGHKMRAWEVGILASMGLTQASVIRKPVVAVFTTGDELVEPGEKIKFGQIYNSNRYTITALIKLFCERTDHSAPLVDTETALREALNCDSEIIITSGGVSAGDKDLIPAVAADLGWKELFHKIAMKPGKPVFFARRNNQLLFGLPGNPLSTAVTCATLVIPALKKMAGLSDFTPKLLPAVLRSESRSGKRMLLWPGTMRREGTELIAEYSSKKSSASLTSLLNSDGLIVERQRGDDCDTSVKVAVLLWDDLLR